MISAVIVDVVVIVIVAVVVDIVVNTPVLVNISAVAFGDAVFDSGLVAVVISGIFKVIVKEVFCDVIFPVNRLVTFSFV